MWFFVQPYQENISISGVILTRDNESGGPYIIINYDDHSGRTDTVTSGTGKSLSTVFVLRGKLELLPDNLNVLADTIIELENALDFTSLDIEFGIDNKGQVYIFQSSTFDFKE